MFEAPPQDRSSALLERLILQKSLQKHREMPEWKSNILNDGSYMYSNKYHSEFSKYYGQTHNNDYKKKGLWKKFTSSPIWWKSPADDNLFKEFCDDTSIHGPKFIVKAKRHLCERIFWIIAFVFGLIGAIYLISDIWGRYYQNPVIVTFQPKDQDIDSLPFPAVTFCNINKFSKKIIQEIERTAKSDMVDSEAKLQAQRRMQYVKNICNSQPSFAKDFDFAAERGKFDDNLPEITITSEDQDDMIDFLTYETVPCEKMLRLCMFGEKIYDCKKIFKPYITDYGKCCVFNILPYSLLIKDPGENVTATEIRKKQRQEQNIPEIWSDEELQLWKKWRYDEGMVLPKHLKRPYRQQRAGVPYGLSVLVDAKTEDYFCPASDATGFRLSITSPLELPHVSEFASVLELGKEVYIEVNPEVMNADEDIRGFTREERQCYFSQEINLTFFQPYSLTNCVDECTVRVIAEKCKCSPFYMPSLSHMTVCNNDRDSVDAKCIDEAKVGLLDTLKDDCGDCDSLCQDIVYHFQTTVATLQDGRTLWGKPDFRSNVKVPTWAYNKMSIVHIFFGSDSTQPKLRTRLFGTVDLIASTGGILGLCLGVSVLSGIEVLYFFTIRVILRLIRKSQRTKQVVQKAVDAFKSKGNHDDRKYNGMMNNSVIHMDRKKIPIYNSYADSRVMPAAPREIDNSLPIRYSFNKRV